MQISDSVWLITGCSTGLGRALAEEALSQGAKVMATARKPGVLADLVQRYPDHCLTARLDVTEEGAFTPVLDTMLKEWGRCDVLVNNAGYGVAGAIEEVDLAQVATMFETNVWGAVRGIKAALPIMRSQGGGRILNISSVAGLVAFSGSGYYCSSKFALEAISESLSQEVAGFGVKVTLIEPGPFRTDFTGRSLVVSDAMPAYTDTEVGRSRSALKDMHGTQIGDPVRAAKAMVTMVATDEPPLRLVLGNPGLDYARKKLERLAKDFDQWETLTRSCDFDS
ncbi:MAG: SDR family NAD(P)-dependent oxidoreductase [Chthonomonas sp.]|nr:SDR family NAD(P)-dependent oxidoreductase [Chthonomonas sp.]